MLAATRAVLAETGYPALTYSEVAQRAGVTRQLVYRWWPVKASLVSEAVFGSGVPPWPTDPTGPLTDDLRYLVQALVDFGCRPDVQAAVTGLMADAGPDTPLPGLVDGFLGPLRAALAALVERGQASGEVRTDVDLDLTLSTIRGAVTLHLIADRTPPAIVVDHLTGLLARALDPGRG